MNNERGNCHIEIECTRRMYAEYVTTLYVSFNNINPQCVYGVYDTLTHSNEDITYLIRYDYVLAIYVAEESSSWWPIVYIESNR